MGGETATSEFVENTPDPHQCFGNIGPQNPGFRPFSLTPEDETTQVGVNRP